MCIECIDELMGDDKHQLISIKKFSKFINEYQKQSKASIENMKNVYDLLF